MQTFNEIIRILKYLDFEDWIVLIFAFAGPPVIFFVFHYFLGGK